MMEVAKKKGMVATDQQSLAKYYGTRLAKLDNLPIIELNFGQEYVTEMGFRFNIEEIRGISTRG